MATFPVAMRRQFAHVAPNNIPQFLRCGICGQPLVDPVRHETCKDREAYCRECIATMTASNSFRVFPPCTCPIPISHRIQPAEDLLQALGQLVVYCPNKDAECSWTGARDALDEHLDNSCLFISCRNKERGCGARGTAEIMRLHLDSCKHRMATKNAAAIHHDAASSPIPKIVTRIENASVIARHDVNPTQGNTIKLNVGGRKLLTSRQTLIKQPTSLLATLFSGTAYPHSDNKGYVLLDRNGDAFALLLDWLRSGRVRHTLTPAERELLQDEAAFWNIALLQDALRAAASELVPSAPANTNAPFSFSFSSPTFFPQPAPLSQPAAAAATAPTPTLVAPDDSSISIVVKDEDGKETFFKIKRKTILGKLMDAYCLRRAVDRNKVEFHADNDTVIVPEASAEDLGLTDGASIFARSRKRLP